MQSGRSRSETYLDDQGAYSPSPIPDFALSWESADQVVAAVRRPSTLPDPQCYHEAIESQAIFELDERQEDGSVETILVVPYSCEYCKRIKQACSRARPACARCRKAGRTCTVVQGGYQMIPGPKTGKLSLMRKKDDTDKTRKESITSPSTQNFSPSRSRTTGRRMASGAAPLPQPLHSSGMPVASGSKRPLSPEFTLVPPRKKAPTKRKEVNTEQSSARGPLAQVVPTPVPSSLKWTFVHKQEDTLQEPQSDHPIPFNTVSPRVWTDTLGSLLTVFPELGKSNTGFSWFQSETPILLLNTNYARGHWINSTTLNIDMIWDFSCHRSELELVGELDTRNLPQPHSYQSEQYSRENTIDRGTETMDLRDSHSPPNAILFPAHMSVSAPLPTPSMQTSPSDHPQRLTCESHVARMNPAHISTQNYPVSGVHSTQPHPASLLSPPWIPLPPRACHPFNRSLAQETTSQPSLGIYIPLKKPPEVDTFLYSHLSVIPVLLWLSHDSDLVPCRLPPEYAYICMGLFFISDLRYAVAQHSVSPDGIAHGRVCWNLTLQWAPGGEDALYDCGSTPPANEAADLAPDDTTRGVLRPWWLDTTGTLSQEDDATLYRPRDLRMQYFSFLPLDLLAEFHPSESFPRGWLCRSCGMINMQVYFRHQICQSTACKDQSVPLGKADPLYSLRDRYQSNTLIQPTDNIPLVVALDSITWDDGMQSWIYTVENGVTLYHIFTGNQESLQQDATTLLERSQCEVLLRKEDSSSPYFSHSTKLSHPNDGSEAMVPGGTPNCVRTAYYMLRDFVHRYGEMDEPRFGEVRMYAWISSGSKKGNLFDARKSPVVVLCLGVEVVLKFTPKGRHEGAPNSAPLDKGKGRARDEDRVGSPPPAPRAGPSHRQRQGHGNQTPFIPWPDTNETPIVTENVADTIAVMDTVSQCHKYDTTSELAALSSNSNLGMEVVRNQVVERGDCKRDEVTKDRAKTSVPEISMTLVHGDCAILCGDDFECQIIRSGTTICRDWFTGRELMDLPEVAERFDY